MIAVNKIDRLDRPQVAEVLHGGRRRSSVGDEIFPVARRTGAGVGAAARPPARAAARGPVLLPARAPTDQPLEVLLAELVREQVLRRTFQEVPHAVEVVIEELDDEREDLVVVRARIWIETESQKGILIGKGGKMIKTVGTAGARGARARARARRSTSTCGSTSAGSWRTDERLLDRLGIE